MSQESVFKYGKKADEATKILIMGFTREAKKISNLSGDVPIAIQHLIIAYHYLHEYIKQAPNYHFEISDNNKTITNIQTYPDPFDHQIWMNQSISSLSDNIYTWKFKINKLKDLMNVCIMPSQSCHLNSMDFWFWDLRPLYSITNKQSIQQYQWKNQNPWLNRDTTPNPNLKQLNFRTGDVVYFTLNVKDSKIGCKINKDPYFVLFNDIEKEEVDKEVKVIKWKLVFSLANKDDSVTLQHFFQHS